MKQTYSYIVSLVAGIALFIGGFTIAHAMTTEALFPAGMEDDLEWNYITVSPDGQTVIALALFQSAPSPLGLLGEGLDGPEDQEIFNTFYISLDGGNTWQGSAPAEDIHFDAAAILDNGTIFILESGVSASLGDNVLLKSADNGNTWDQVTLPLLGRWADISTAHDNTLITGIGSEILISNDNGNSFEVITIEVDGETISDINFSFITNSQDTSLFIAGGFGRFISNKLYISRDQGETWHDSNVSLDEGFHDRFTRSAISEAGEIGVVLSGYTNQSQQLIGEGLSETAAPGGALIITRNQGDTWEMASPQSHDDPMNWTDVAVSSDGQVILVSAQEFIQLMLGEEEGNVLAEGGLFLSLDGGFSWEQLFTDASAQNWTSVAVDGSGTHLFAGTADGNMFRIVRQPERETPVRTSEPRRRSSGGQVSQQFLQQAGVTLTRDITPAQPRETRNERIIELITGLERGSDGRITQAGFVQFIMGLIQILR